MAWSQKMSQLNEVLADLYYTQASIIRVVQISDLRPSDMNLSGSAMQIWNSVIDEAEKRGKLDRLIESAHSDYPNNPFLISAKSSAEINYSLQPNIDDVSVWKEPDRSELEVLTFEKSTLLPISFLEMGILKSKAVAKIEIKTGNMIDVGTGFLFKVPEIEGLYFMTNHHVIRNQSKFRNTTILFNFELDMDGNSKKSESFMIKSKGVFMTSPIAELDVTICELEDPYNILAQFGYLELNEIEVPKNEFVNIIQHPGGQWKQLSIYHNIVTNSEDRIIQYLTDTLKGSSGAPVFNSDWQVVALHHSGGDLKEGELPLPFGFKSRNEGIRINQIIKFFKEKLTAV